MCWACEPDRFWEAYAKYMAAKEGAPALNQPGDGSPLVLVIPANQETGEQAPPVKKQYD
jgi:hypothetical protein